MRLDVEELGALARELLDEIEAPPGVEVVVLVANDQGYGVSMLGRQERITEALELALEQAQDPAGWRPA